MGSDRARISFDRTREYRSLVAQQGRVTLEADVNEQTVIASEALRLETIDLIGPTGTPDNGYLVSVDASGNLTVGPGIMYVGGWRMEFPQAVPVANQPEWIDQPPTLSVQNKNDLFIIALLVSEQEVQAVEDQALREVALGGPDTAARTRLMQHIVAVPTPDNTCAAALKDWDTILKPLGLVLEPDTLALYFTATLQVSFYPPAGPVDPCCPPAQGGYLGADNQLVRVTVTSYDSTKGSGTLLWGWNNASFLYRATLVNPTANPQILTLSPAPVDSAHTPQINQVVEVLRSTMQLGNPADLNFIAAPEGQVITLAGSGSVFDPTTNQLTLPTGNTLPPDYASDTNPLFVRLWQAEVPFTDGIPAQLDQVSGLAVTINMSALPTGPLEARPFWDFAVRPNTPQQVYPQRFLQQPQHPTGPRRWLTDLAIVKYVPSYAARNLGSFQVIADCRIPFPPHTGSDDCGCCGITLNPAQVTSRGGLQAVIDAQAALGQSLSLRPGEYVLTTPLALTKAHAGFSLSGCGPGGRAHITVDPNFVANFTAGMITLAETSTITLQGLSFELPLAPDPALAPPIGTNLQYTPYIAVGLNIQSSTSIVIDDCTFLFPSPTSSPNTPVLYVGAGIYASENCSGLRILRNRFDCTSGGTITPGSYRFLFGVGMSPSTLNPQPPPTPIQLKPGTPADTPAQQAATGLIGLPAVNDLLDDVEITDNRFAGLSFAVFAFAQFGMIRCNSNRASNCCAGFWFLDSDLAANTAFGQAALADEQQPGNTSTSAATIRQFMQPVLVANAINFSAALRPAEAMAKCAAAPTVSEETRRVLLSASSTTGQAAYTAFLNSLNNDPAKAADAQANPPQPTAPAAPTLTDAEFANASAAYATLQSVGVARAVFGTTLVPTLYVRDNDVQLVAYVTTADTPVSLQGIRCMLSLSATAGSLLVSGNRVEAPNGNSIAVSTEWAPNTVISSNLFNQLGVEFKAAQPCAVFLTGQNGLTAASTGLAAITGNLVNASWLVTPARSFIPSTNDWRFLNTVL